MRILLTNDDGINAPGLKTLEAIAAEIAGPTGEVFVVAPAFEKSGVAHCVNYTHPTMISEFGPRRFAVEGNPADCVLAGIYEVMADQAPDLVLSGVNRGNNAGEAVLYSGTVGAAMEAALQGVPGIALSQFFGPKNRGLDDPFDAALTHGAATVRSLLDHGIWDSSGYRLFYNVNFPPCPAAEVGQTMVVPQGCREVPIHHVEAHLSPTGRKFLWVKGISPHLATQPGSDVAVNLEGHIAITPLRADLTDYGAVDALKAKIG